MEEDAELDGVFLALLKTAEKCSRRCALCCAKSTQWTGGCNKPRLSLAVCSKRPIERLVNQSSDSGCRRDSGTLVEFNSAVRLSDMIHPSRHHPPEAKPYGRVIEANMGRDGALRCSGQAPATVVMRRGCIFATLDAVPLCWYLATYAR